MTSSITVPSGVTLTIDPGVTLRFGTQQALTVQQGGSLIADASASPSTPILLTTANASPAPGQWYGVQFQAGSAGALKYVTVQDAGYPGYAVQVAGASPTLDHVSFNSNSGTNLVMTGGSNVIATATNFQGASSGTAVSIDSGTLDARDSYWDNSSGPTIASNSYGTGEVITGNGAANVNYAGFTCGPVTPAGATPCNATVGGANLTLTAGSPGTVALGWSMFGVQAGYQVLRVTPSGQGLLPTGGMLPATASSFTDTSAVPSYDLYADMPVNASGASLGVSDLLGYLPNVRSASGVPLNFTITLRQSQIAKLSWTAPAGATGYTLMAIPTDGSAQRTQNLPASATSAADNTGGKPTIYVLEALNGQAALGNTDGLLAFPGIATVSAPNFIKSAPTAAPAATPITTRVTQLRSRAQSVLEQLGRQPQRAALERQRNAPGAARQ